MSSRHFPEYGSDYAFAQHEEKILDFWRGQKVFERSLKKSAKRPTFFFYDGPPFATGLPHYGHLIAGTMKDIVPRYWAMRGYHVPRRFGWDCHGLPVEFEMEKTLNLSGSLAILDYGVGKFNEACRGIVLRYTGEWRKTVERIGRWIDMDNDYKTMDPEFMESVWWVFKQLWDKGLVYEGKKVVPYSWRLTAPLSNFEASLNYKDVQDPAITILLPLVKDPSTALAVWTTTPWTLPSNLAVAVNKNSDVVKYAAYKLAQPVGAVDKIVVAENLAANFGLTEKIKDVTAGELIDQHYVPLFSSFDDAERKAQRAFRVIHSDHVSSGDGTGLVHMAPAFGEDDFFACQREGIQLVDPTDMQASFLPEVAKDPDLKDVVGLFVKDGDKHIIKVLKARGRLLKQDTLQHAYPFCERSDTPLIYKAISSWFVKVEAIKEKMVANNQKIHWVPEHIKDGRFGNWLSNARDWCISRNRFWGTPIPVWNCEKCSHKHVVGSQAELEQLAGKPMPDLHKHFVDDVVADCPKCKAKGALKRTPEVLDCWFESGSMPYAQEHYPFENREKFEKGFPADFIAEGLDQTRGWFYTLTVLSAALFDKPAFKNCIVNGMVLAEDGKKMSKRLRNYPDPSEIMNKHGADALRLYLMQSPAMHAEDLRFSERGLIELMRAVMLPLWNAYGFFASYANIDGFSEKDVARAPTIEKRPELDRWILARAKELEASVHKSLEGYKLYEVAPLLIDFIDDLTNWYIRLSRARFWAEGMPGANPDKAAAYATLWSALDQLATVLAPALPFVSELLHAALRGVETKALKSRSDYESVHETLLREPKTLALNAAEQKILDEMNVAKRLMLLGRALRGEAKIGLRQPLQKLRVAGLSAKQIDDLKPMRELVLREVNVRELELVSKASDLVEESAKPNFKTLGKKAGGAMKQIQAELGKWDSAQIAAFEKAGKAVIAGIELTLEDLQIVRKAKEGRLAQAAFGMVGELDTQLTDELVREGLQRELINRIQQRRKDMKLHLADRIWVRWASQKDSLVAKILKSEGQSLGLIAGETLATQVVEESGLASKGEGEDFGEHGRLYFEIGRV